MSADFVSTSQLQQLEELLIKRRSPFYLVLGFLLVPTLMIGSVCCLYWWDTSRPVVTDFKVQTQYVTPQGVIVDGTMNKLRDCEVIDVAARTNQREVTRVDFLDLKSWHGYSRLLGPQKWGPWLIWAPEGDGVTIFVRHRCNPLWTHSDELTSFVVGKQ